MDERKSVKSPNAARDKTMSMDSSTQLEHAAWQDGGVVLFLLPAPLAHALLGAFRPCEVDGTRAEGPRVLQLALHKVQHTNPGLACSPDQAKSRCWALQTGSMGFQDVVEP